MMLFVMLIAKCKKIAKFFQKSFKKVLTNRNLCDRIAYVPRREQLTKANNKIQIAASPSGKATDSDSVIT